MRIIDVEVEAGAATVIDGSQYVHHHPHQPSDRALELLRAKAAVCDAYRDWLETPRPRQRWAVSAALLALSELERGAGKR